LPELLRDVQEYRMIVYSLVFSDMMLGSWLFGVKIREEKEKHK
jgi:hypothetical protein